jgi:hypothetical protein
MRWVQRRSVIGRRRWGSLAGRERKRSGGDHAFVPIGVPHAVRAGAEGCHALHISSPACFAELIQRAGIPAYLPGAAEGFDPERFAAIAAHLGDELLGPPGAVPADLSGQLP